MPEWEETLPEWNEEGTEPDQAKKNAGWQVEERPPAGWFNWLFNRVYQCLKELHLPGAIKPFSLGLNVRNETGAQLSASTLIYVSGWNEAEGRWLVNKASANEEGKRAKYVLPESIANNANGLARKSYRLTGVDTSGAAVGDPVYLSTAAGGWTLTAPTGENEVQQIVGRVAVVDAAAGEIEFNLTNTVIKWGSNELQGATIAGIRAGTTKTDVGLANVINALQVKNSGNVPELMANTLANRPTAGTANRYFLAIDTGEIYRDTGTEWELAAASRDEFITHLLDYAMFRSGAFGLWGDRSGHRYSTNFNPDGSILEELRNTATNDLVASMTTTFNDPSPGDIKETLYVAVTGSSVAKVTTFNPDGSIAEEVSEVI